MNIESTNPKKFSVKKTILIITAITLLAAGAVKTIEWKIEKDAQAREQGINWEERAKAKWQEEYRGSAEFQKLIQEQLDKKWYEKQKTDAENKLKSFEPKETSQASPSPAPIAYVAPTVNGKVVPPPGLSEEATRACQNAGIKDVWCRNDLLAISYHETAKWTDFDGDSGCSTGWVHINRCVHKHITKEATMNAAFAFKWTIERLVAYGYPVYRTKAVQCHNGCGVANGYAKTIKAKAELF